ncbi:MAG: hypothetical protein K9L02_06670 [Acholeplasmataceae bacterium]|nr:hypothetical protein [Acholeplasmataceae bacterium]
MFKKGLVLFFILAFFTILVDWSVIQTVKAATDHQTVTSERNHVLADVNEVIDLTTLKVKGTFGEIFMDEANISSVNPVVTITDTTITISEVGVFPVNFNYQSNLMTIYFITKLAEDTEYVIYEEDFTGMANGALPSGYNLYNNLGQGGGSAAISSERLMLSPMTIVLFPSYLSGFTNYVIDTDMRMTAATNTGRWTSVLFRYSTENYFQMAIRNDASAANGVEFAKRIDGSWNVPVTAAYTEALDPATQYHLTVDVKDTTVIESIDEQVLVTYDSAFEFTHGRIGVQADNVTVYYDNIRITLPETYIEGETYDFVAIPDVYQPETGIVAPATVLTWFNSADQIDEINATTRPATFIFTINADLDVIDTEGNVIMTLLETLTAVNGKVIPAFYTNDIAIATSLGESLKTYRIFDSAIISESGEVILAARAAHSLMRGVLNYPMADKEFLTEEDLIEVRRTTNTAQAVASILPSRLLTQELVFYMQHRLMTVWVSSEDDALSQYQAILTGANGIVTQNYEGLYEIYGIFGPNTHVRRPLVIAHRGLYDAANSLYPENTIEGGLESLSRGADVLELDVHLTIDWEVVVIHDNTTDRTAPDYPSHTVASSSFNSLMELTLRDTVGGRTDIHIPSFRDYIQTFKDTGVVIFVEIKPTQPLLVEALATIINEEDMYDQIVIIAFGAANIQKMNEVMPEMANGHLTGAVLNAQNDTTSMTNTLTDVVPINSTLNPSYGAITLSFLEDLVHRGITIWPWTVDDLNIFVQLYNAGVGGLTTNYMDYLSDTFNRISFESYRYEYVIDEAVGEQIKGTIETQSGTTYPLLPSFVIIDDGGTGITFDSHGNITAATATGTAYVYTTFSSTMPNGTPIIITSDVIEINILEVPTMGTLAIVLISLGSVSALSIGAFFGFKWFKLRKLAKI